MTPQFREKLMNDIISGVEEMLASLNFYVACLKHPSSTDGEKSASRFMITALSQQLSNTITRAGYSLNKNEQGYYIIEEVSFE